MPEEPKEWITVNGKHIPLDENGEPMNETGKKTLGKETDKSDEKAERQPDESASAQQAEQAPKTKSSATQQQRAQSQTERQSETGVKLETTPQTGDVVTKSDGLTYTKTLAQYREAHGGDTYEGAKAFFKNELQGKTVKCQTANGEIVVQFSGGSWGEIKRGLKQDPIKAEIIPLMPEILTTGEYSERPLYKERTDFVSVFHEYHKRVPTSQGDKETIVDVAERPRNVPRYSVYSATHEGAYGYEERKRHTGDKKSPVVDSGSSPRSTGDCNDSVVKHIIHDEAQNEKGQPCLEIVNIRFADEPIETEADEMPRDKPRGDVMAFDVKSSRRHKDNNGYLHVDASNITKEQVAPYYGNEIAGWQELELEPHKLYYMYRPAEELKKAAHTFNGMPILFEHHQTSADNPAKDYTIGSLGTDAEFRSPYIVNSLVFTDGEAIDAIERGEYKELSAAYCYTPVMKGGIFDGQKYDGIMTDIKANHVALVKKGRAGHDVIVADSKPEKRRINPTMKTKRRIFAFDGVPEGAEVNLAAMMEAVEAVEAQREEAEPEINADSSIDDIVDKFFPDADEVVKGAVKAMLEHLKGAPTADNEPLEGDDDEGIKTSSTLDDDEGSKEGGYDSDLKQAIADCNIDADDPNSAKAFAEGVKYGEKLMQNKAEREKRGESEGMRKLLEDQKEELAEQKAAMDSKLKSMKEKTMSEMKAHYKALYAAAQDCRSVLGNLVDPMAFDSAEDIYRKALAQVGVNTLGVHASAYPELLKLARRGMTERREPTVMIAADSAPDETTEAARAGLARIQH